jgi:matrixin
MRRARDDWNALFRDALGVDAFAAAPRDAAQVRVDLEPATTSGLMGVTYLHTDDTGIIRVPVRITVVEPTARGQTSRETLLYQVLAHELGHALGLPHARDPRSLMCCEPGAVDFQDPAARDAYIDARRRPHLRSVRSQLVDHYARFWRR